MGKCVDYVINFCQPKGRQLIKEIVMTSVPEKPVNCWQYMSCGREPGGLNADRLGVCPVCKESELDGVHGGKNAGRSCWIIAGLLSGRDLGCGNRTVGGDCAKCDFYNTVKMEEGKYIWPNAFLLSLLKK